MGPEAGILCSNKTAYEGIDGWFNISCQGSRCDCRQRHFRQLGPEMWNFGHLGCGLDNSLEPAGRGRRLKGEAAGCYAYQGSPLLVLQLQRGRSEQLAEIHRHPLGNKLCQEPHQP